MFQTFNSIILQLYLWDLVIVFVFLLVFVIFIIVLFLSCSKISYLSNVIRSVIMFLLDMPTVLDIPWNLIYVPQVLSFLYGMIYPIEWVSNLFLLIDLLYSIWSMQNFSYVLQYYICPIGLICFSVNCISFNSISFL